MIKIILISFFGYFLPRVAVLVLGKKSSKTSSKKWPVFTIGLIYSIVISIIFILPNILHSAAFIMLVMLAIFDEYFGWMRALAKKFKLADKDIKAASKQDSSWDKIEIIQTASELIDIYRSDWANADLNAITKYSTDRFVYHNRLFFEALNNLHRKISQEVNTTDIQIINAHDSPDDEQDRFSLYLSSNIDIKVSDLQSKKLVINTSKTIEEIYEIDREGGEWKLDASSLAVEGGTVTYDDFQQFAHKNGYYYNNRTSYLLLPYNEKLSFSSFNDQGHMILGVAHNLLFSIFQLRSSSNNGYMVATANIPGDYPHILIRNRKTNDLITSNVKRVKTEWPELNENYDVFVGEKDIERLLISIVSPEIISYLISLENPVTLELYSNTAYIIFPSDNSTLGLVPEILSQIYKRSFISNKL